MKQYLTFALVTIVVIVASFYTSTFIIYLYHKTDAILLIKDYAFAFLVPAFVYSVSGIVAWAKICDKYNWD